MKGNLIGVALAAGLVIAGPAAFAADARCTAPGPTLITDPSGDQLGGATNAAFDIVSISVSEPKYNASRHLTFVIKTPGLSTLPSNGVWRVRFTVGTAMKFVGMETPAEENGPTFTYGTYTTGATTEGAADARSHYDTDGTITIVVPVTSVGSPAAGSKLTAVSGLTQQLVGAAGTGATPTYDSTSAAEYTLVADGTCPLPPDTDQDGVADADDLCPGTPSGTSVDATGCPAAAACATSGSALAASQVPYAGPVTVDPEVLKEWSTLPLTAKYGAFVHFYRLPSLLEQDGLLKSSGLSIVHDFRRYTNSVFVEGPVLGFKQVINSPWVQRIEYNRPMQYLDATQSWATRTRTVQEKVSGGPFRDAGGNILDGTGVTLGIIDDGLFGAHPDFEGRVVHNFKLTTPAAGLPTSYTDVGYGDSGNAGGHGTHVTGIATGDGARSGKGGYPANSVTPFIQGTFTSASPKSKIIVWGNGVAILVIDATLAYRHLLDNVGLPEFRTLKAVNNSYGAIGGGAYDPNSTGSQLIKRIVGCGINMVFAAGNDGGDGTEDTTSPTCKDPTPGVICVASYNDQGTGALNAPLSSFSSRGKKGPTDEDAAKYPDIAAPGDLSTSTCIQGDPNQAVCTGGDDAAAETEWQPFYGTISGTSMATPNVVSVIGVIAQARPDLTPAEIEDLIQDTARKIGNGYQNDPQNPGGTIHFGYGAGLIDTQAALRKLGITQDGLRPQDEEWTIFENDADADVQEPAANAVKLTMQNVNLAGPGVMYRLTVGNGTGFTTSTSLNYRIESNVRGTPARTTIVATPTGVAAAEPGTNNTALATNVKREGNVISFFVPYSQLGYPPINEPIHNIRVVTENAAGAIDYAPSLASDPVAAAAVRPMYGRAFTTRLAPGTIPPSDEKTCKLPGLTSIVSPAGTVSDSSQTGMDDFRHLWIAEPGDMPGKLVFTLKVDNLNPAPLANYRWIVYLKVPSSTNEKFIAMDTVAPGSSAAPRFIYGTKSTIDTPAAAVGTFTVDGTLDAASKFNTDGTITLVVDKANAFFNLQTGDAVTGIAVSVRQTTNGQNGAGLTVDSGSALDPYVLAGNFVCPTVAGAPVARLVSDVTQGQAPLTVNFNGSTSSGGTGGIVSYTFDFGDNTPVITQASPTIQHVFQDPSNYTVTMSVKDSTDVASATPASLIIKVKGVNVPPVPDADSDKSVLEGDRVTLHGSATDANGGVVTYRWSQVSGPAVALDDANSATVNFLAPDVESVAEVVLKLTATDEEDASASDTVTVVIRDRGLDATQSDYNGQNKVGALAPGLLFALAGSLLLHRRRR